MSEPLVSLEEFNARARAAYQRPDTNGIACPKCGGELVDERGRMLLSDPPQMAVGCPACGWKGTRVC